MLERANDRPRGREVPSVALPKGGGALHAIDEKFSVNAVNGTTDIHVPLPFSKTRSGFDGAIALQYSSGGGNGPCGLGWRFSLPSIQRRTDKQLPRYADADESDTFVLAGAEDLVPAYVQQSDGSWLPDRETVGLITVERYRPRIEGAFARIEKIAVVGETGAYWKVTSRDNICTIYGRSAGARVADPKDASRIFRWLPEWSFDDKGNCVEYVYKAEDIVNVPSCVAEKNRLSGVAPFANRYLKSVSYGNSVPYYADPASPYNPAPPADVGYLFEAVFDYGEHDLDAPTPAETTTWPCRRDPFSDCRAGFEMRCYRLCRRVLFFHSFAELDANPYLVRSVDLAYAHFQFQSATAYDQEADFIVGITDTHYRKTGATAYASKSLPMFACDYQPLAWDKSVRAISPEDAAGAPGGISQGYQWVDLRAEGLQGILTEQADSWYYKENLGGGHFSAAATVLPKPSFTGAARGVLMFQDLNADGSRQVVAAGAPHGFFALTDDNAWLPFQPFPSDLKADVADPNVRFLDLDGDGKPDVLIAEEQLFRWYPSIGTEGFGDARFVAKGWDEDAGPAVIFADGTETIFTADMNGDGLSEIVRVRNGEVCYWPNLGFGRFGAKVTMLNSPRFDFLDRFDPRRIQFADISGTGAADIIYLGRGGMNAWINFAGNAWSAPQDIDPFPGTERPNKVAVLDLLGNGTACIVWSSELPGNAAAPLRYVDLMGGKKPYILSGYRNNLGKEVELEYRSSSFYFLLDKREGTPWVTKLPFPTMCLSATRTRDAVSGSLYVQRYRYRHGYYDHAEREFRGFGMIEQSDAESFDRFAQTGATTASDQPVQQPPVRTRTWYHTGAFLRGGTILRHFAADYYVNPVLAEARLPDAVIEAAPGYTLTPDEAREAARACKGMMLRREIYADDGTPLATVPYAVEESNCHIRLLQPQLGDRYAVFLPHASETISYHYERNPADPRITHELNTVIDEVGNVVEQAAISYGRVSADASLPADVQQVQGALRATYAVHSYTNDVATPSAYRLRQACETQTYELTGFSPAGTIATPDEIRNAFAGATPLGYEEAPHSGILDKRLLKQQRNLFASDANVNTALTLGTQGALGLPYQGYTLQFTPGLLSALYGGKVTAAMLTEGSFNESDDMIAAGLFPPTDELGAWWKGDGTVRFPANPDQQFYLPEAYLDPYGNVTTVHYYAGYHLLIDQVTDALGDQTTVQSFEFRVLQPQSIQDINDNISQASFDILGLVVGTALLGKGTEADDLIGFVPDLTQAQTDAFLADPLGQGAALLQNATSRFVYDLTHVPAVAAQIQRETHAKAAAASEMPSRLRYAFEYSDGLLRVAMTKAEAEPGKALTSNVAADGTLTVTTVDSGANPRWVGSGRTIFNNKGDPVMKYEPYFSLTPAYETAPQLVETGVTSVLTYDPVGRAVLTDFPDGTTSRIEFDAWKELHYDQNDTVLASAWYAARKNGGLGVAAQAAAQRTVLHDSTPHAVHLDGLGHTIYALADNKFLDPSTNAVVEEFYATVTQLDIEGQQLAVRDPRGNTVLQQSFDMAGEPDATVAMDAGARWILKDAMGKALYGWDAKGNRFHTLYDTLNRPTQHEVLSSAAVTIVFGKSLYGTDKTKNQNGKLVTQYDKSGVVSQDLFDFKGNTLSTTRTFTADYIDDIDWSNPGAITPQLKSYTTLASFDALNRVVTGTTPDGSVTGNTYSVANLLTAVNVAIGSGGAQPFITSIAHDAKGQRLGIAYANGASSTFTYDPLTFRVVRALTTRQSDGATLQDLGFTYDPIGNITTVTDAAQQTVFFANAVVAPQCDFTYDAVYWLRNATGRELIGLNAPVSEFDAERIGQALPSDGSALRRYLQRYAYDAAGNMSAMAHASGNGPFTNQWTRSFTPEAATNRLASSLVGSTLEPYAYDVHGNLTQTPGLASLNWDFDNHFRSVDLGGGGTAYYTYDSEGNRVRKVIARQGSIVEERLYVGAFEVFTRTNGGAIDLQRETLHVMDGSRRLAMVDSRTQGDDGTPAQLIRYQLANHLGTALLEIDDAAQIISYEEFYPFGSTSFQSVDSSREVPAKRYRYTGKERDEETGFYYHGARYYLPWLARWSAPDPAGIEDGLNRYIYCGNHPIASHDPTGMWDWGTVAIVAAVVVVSVAVTVATAGLAGPVIAGAAATVLGSGTVAATVATGVVVGAVAGAAGSAAGELTRQVASGEKISGSAILHEALTGAAFGAVTGGFSAAASTVRGTAAISRASTAFKGSSVGRATATVQRTVSSGASAIARVPGVKQVVSGAQAVAKTGARGLQTIERSAENVGIRAGQSLFSESSAGGQAVQRFAQTRSIAGAFNQNTPRVFRVQGGAPPAASRVRITTGAGGELEVQGKAMLHVTFEDAGHARYFQNKRPGSEIVSFEVDRGVIDEVRNTAQPQALAKTFPGAPQIDDPTLTSSAFGLRTTQQNLLKSAAVPGSGAVGGFGIINNQAALTTGVIGGGRRHAQ
jgi:RHS repeat-associated protein